MSKTKNILIKTITLIILLTISTLSVSIAGAEVRGDFVINSAGIFRVNFGGNSVTVKELYPAEKEYTYTASEKILDCCCSGKATYALSKSAGGRSQAYVCKMSGGKISSTILNGVSISEYNAAIAVDARNRIYITNEESKVSVFNKNGKMIGTDGSRYYGLTVCGGVVLAANGDGVFILDGTSAEKVNIAPMSYHLRAVSETEYVDGSGNIYNIYGGVRKLSDNVACLRDYYVVSEGSIITAYDRNSLQKVAEFEADYAPEAVFGFGNKLVLVDGNIIKTYSQDIFRKKSDTPSPPTSAQPAGLSFGEYEVSGKYIYVSAGTKRSTFKNAVSYEGYELSFNGKRTNHMGTGLKLLLTKNGKTKEFTFIVPGDINGTGEVNKTDLSFIFDNQLGIDKLKGTRKKAADINRDGRISNTDLVMTEWIRTGRIVR